MPGLNLTTIVVSIIVVLLLALPFVAARLPRSRRAVSRDRQRSGPGPGFTYALVPRGGHPDEGTGDQKGSWQWCLAFVPEKTSNGGSEMPPWWAPAPPWDTTAEWDRDFSSDAAALQAIIEETSTYPEVKERFQQGSISQ